jgi:hypothetical protein
MSVASATPDQLKRLDNFVMLQRAATVKLWELDRAITALVQDWNADILGIIGAPQGTVVKDSTGYAGAVPLTDTQVTNLYGILQTLQSDTMTDPNKALFLLATGPNNML